MFKYLIIIYVLIFQIFLGIERHHMGAEQGTEDLHTFNFAQMLRQS